jgi:hypothetical protein
MKTILAAFLGVALLAGLASQGSAATRQLSTPHNVPLSVAAADYDNPGFGTRQWWELQEDRG